MLLNAKCWLIELSFFSNARIYNLAKKKQSLVLLFFFCENAMFFGGGFEFCLKSNQFTSLSLNFELAHRKDGL